MSAEIIKSPDCEFVCYGSGCLEQTVIRELIAPPMTELDALALERIASYCKLYKESLIRIDIDRKA
jgi:hypothetical protein